MEVLLFCHLQLRLVVLRLRLLNCLVIIMMQRYLLNKLYPPMMHQGIQRLLMQSVLQPAFEWIRHHSSLLCALVLS